MKKCERHSADSLCARAFGSTPQCMPLKGQHIGWTWQWHWDDVPGCFWTFLGFRMSKKNDKDTPKAMAQYWMCSFGGPYGGLRYHGIGLHETHNSNLCCKFWLLVSGFTLSPFSLCLRDPNMIYDQLLNSKSTIPYYHSWSNIHISIIIVEVIFIFLLS